MALSPRLSVRARSPSDRPFGDRVVALAIVAGLAACGGQRGEDAPRPNIVIVLADDQRYDTLSCTGNEVLETPSIDALARDGVLFTRAYVVTSLCCPARATLLTGRYPHETGIRSNADSGPFLDGGAGFPERLQNAGYETAFVGKWHIENPGAAPQPGFDHWVSFEGQGRYQNETYNVDGLRKRIEGFNTDVLTRFAVEFVARPRESPFCLILSVKNLHGPYFPPERHRRHLLGTPFPPPPSIDEAEESLPAYVRFARTTLRNRFFDHEDASREEYVRGYHQLVFSLDESVGRLTEALARAGVQGETLVIYTSDGGFLWGEHGMYRKRASYEPSIHVPLILCWPARLPRGVRSDAIALNTDLSPTILAVAGASVPEGLPGRNLLDALSEGRRADWRSDFLYVDAWREERDGPFELAVVGERTKYVRYRWGEIEELLIDRASDPDERTNLVADAAFASELEDRRARLAELLDDVGLPTSWMDPLPAHAADDDDGD